MIGCVGFGMDNYAYLCERVTIQDWSARANRRTEDEWCCTPILTSCLPSVAQSEIMRRIKR